MNWIDVAFDCIPADDDLRQAWAVAFGVGAESVAVVSDIAEEDPWTDPRIRIALERFRRPGEFPLQVTVMLRVPELAARVAERQYARALIGRVCAELACRALTSNESVNPYEWALHTPDGMTTQVHVDAKQLDEAGAFVLLRQPAAAG
ncbi:MAG: hypothetical protein M3N47_07290 [Chloroflexota bacterium]|nr:hypothetical protein [Chloroflexota bacterium]